jgi:DNA polymerase-1
MKAQFDKLFGTGKEYDEIDTNGNEAIAKTSKFEKSSSSLKKTNEDQFDLFGFSDDESG